MTDPVLKDPRELYYESEFPKQDQETPALQKKMKPVPDCGEESYVGHERLLNRRVLITGGDSGIGRAAAIAYAREGADIALQFYPGEEPDAKQVAKYVEEAGRKAVLLPFDLRDAAAPEKMVVQAVKELGGLDTLVLNAAQQITQPSLAELTMEQVRDTFDVNIISMFATVKAALPHLPAGSSIITTTSVQAFSPSGHLLDYAVTKAAIANFTVGLAKQLSKKGIRVNGVDLDSLATRRRPTGRKITGLRARLFNGAGRTAGRISASLCFLSLQRSKLRNRPNLRGNRWRSNQLIERT